MQILDRYLLKEIVAAWSGIASLLLLVTLGVFLGDTLADVARGSVPAQLLLVTLGLRSVEALTVLLPLSLFLAVMLALGRLYRDSEMTVISSVGISRVQLMRPLAWLLAPGVPLLLVLALWVSPWAQRTSKSMINEVMRDVSVAGLKAGQFHPIAANDSVVYVERLGDDGASFTGAFIHTERNGRKDVITAARGEQYQDEAGNRYLALFDGHRSEGVPGQADYRLMRFARNDVRLPDAGDSEGPRLKHAALTLEELTEDPGLAEWAEIHWRLAPPLAALVLGFLAVPLARTTPRQGYYGNLIVAVLIYVVYANLLAVGKSWLETGDVPVAVGLWWVHGLLVLLTLGLMRQRRAGRHRVLEQAPA